MGRRERKNEKKKQVVMSIVLSILMVMSLAGIFIGSTTTPTATNNQNLNSEYNGYTFTQLNTGQFSTEVNGQERRFYFHPLSTIGLQVSQEALYDLHQAGMIVVTFNPESPDIQAIEVSRYEMGTNLDKNILSAVTKNSTLYPYTVYTCESAQPGSPVIQFQQSNTTRIIYDNGCITINATGADVIRASERLIYDLMGVIQ